MNSMISALYHGNLHPDEHDCSNNNVYSILAESCKQDEAWLLEKLNDEEKRLLTDMIQAQTELNHLTCYESFRDGFILGASLVMEVCSGARAVWDEQ